MQYKNQVVAKRKGAEDVASDSLRTLQIMQFIVEHAQLQAGDSLQIMQKDNKTNTVDSSMIQQSIQRDENDETVSANEIPRQQIVQNSQIVLNNMKPAEVKKEIKPILKPAQKPAPVKKVTQQPKAVMQKKNDYAPIP